jgi:5'/3'-nucleotidase
MRILLSNDDGYFAPGLAVLAASLSAQGHQVTVVAPERDRSGASNSLTLDRPLVVRQTPAGFRYVNGTPTDCVHLAVTGLLPELPEMVISGINHGANMGDDTIYSGTVAAAMEGFLLEIPAMAVSLANIQQENFQTAADFVAGLVGRFDGHRFEAPVLLNINVPDVPPDAVQGVEVTRLGKRHKAQDVVQTINPRNQVMYWVGAAGGAQDSGPGTDFYAVASNRISITPLQIDLTSYPQFGMLREWLAP